MEKPVETRQADEGAFKEVNVSIAKVPDEQASPPAASEDDTLFVQKLQGIMKQELMKPMEKELNDEAEVPYFMSKFYAIDNGLRDGRGRVAIVLLIVAAFGFLWAAWVGMPSPLFGSDEWILRRGRIERAVLPFLWYASGAVEVCWIASWFTFVLLLVTSSRKPCTNPNSRSYVVPFILLLNVSFVLVLVGWLLL